MRTIGQGRYELDRTINHDGNGLLWKARDNDTGQQVIVKELIPPDDLEGQALHIHSQHAFRDARLAKRLSSPTLAKVYDAINEDGTIYVVTEQVTAPRLNDLVEDSGPQPEAWVTLMADQLLTALEAAQDAGIMHHGVTPRRVAIIDQDEATVKLTDFGFGTVSRDPTADMWALGKTLYYAVEGRPLKRDRPIMKVCTGPLAQLIPRLLEPDPEERIRPHRARQVIYRALGDSQSPATVERLRIRRRPMRKRLQDPVPVPQLPQLASLVGRQISNGRYVLTRELGRGGMGIVWLAKDTVLGREVAVKELMVPGGIPVDQRGEYAERVLREARIASRLVDPGIVTVHDLIREHNDTFIVMELVDAPTLEDLVNKNGPMQLHKVAKLADDLLSVLEVAHEATIVHRDVKPSNVMVPSRGSAKLADFGLAQSYDDPKLTSIGTIIGSPAYMSPERMQGGQPSDVWDLWALGATLYFAAEGRGAFERATLPATMVAVMTEKAELRRSRGALADLIVGLLERDPAERIRIPAARALIERATSAST
ncbi:serine/threonine protein kinase [Kibdelosporangium banguiense]|uniref:non-specific serine/threonine protein kinase n=1 Tax=Kibdelosporangium banguiense TaxID=1365924 RepID=A0ABS4U1C3_9PSEU|nr:serine/threonine-protein kinase [Kibdelosporangium banguiense]MBP2330447.1 serine/threonine protein kinase [Kibdelosporangium banguiense]